MREYERKRLDDARRMWDDAAASFDEEPDHGLRDPNVHAAWTDLLRSLLPQKSGAILDIGCGTGSLSIVLAGLGWTVSGIDLSPEMIARAEAKARAADLSIDFHVMDAAYPDFPPLRFDAIMCRHLLWALPDTAGVLVRWVNLVKPGGRLVMIEGFWHTGVGMHTEQIVVALPPSVTNVHVHDLSARTDLWGVHHSDERFAIAADVRA